MNSNQIKGAVKDAAGKVQRKVGEATGNSRQQAKGGAKQVEGKAQKAVGKVQEAVQETGARRRT